ncbi:MAG: sigma-54-dependent Fis family transcriptional regulator, partial [Nitrospirae bacterium]
MKSAKILVVDDEKLLRWSLEQNLTKAGYEVLSADKGRLAVDLFKQERPDVVLLDIHLPDISGLKVIEEIKAVDQNAVVIMITAYGDIETAVKSMKAGAYDFVEKPFNMEKLNILIDKALETVSLKREVSELRSELKSKYGFDSIIGQSAQMQQVFEMIKKVAASDASTVFISGESGTGKDLVARVIHYESRRADRPFLEINCTAIPETLIESELFGYEKGAFTDAKTLKKGLFELADGGSIFLDEIGDMKLHTQAKLLKVLETKSFKRIGGVKDISVDVRIIAATNKNLEEEVKKGNFREDLYYRLKVIPIHLPPLRERDDDILLLAKYFIDMYNREFKKSVKGLSKEVERLFLSYAWPGNVRELKNVIERVMILENTDYIKPEHLPPEIHNPGEVQKRNVSALEIDIPAGGLDIEEVEKKLIERALEVTKGNQSKAARLLNLSRDAFRYRMQKYG